MFKDMGADPYLKSAGIAGDWPHGRGAFVSEDRGFIVWVGEEDHLRVMTLLTGTRLATLLGRLEGFLAALESACGLSVAESPRFGHVTSCPSNLGTGMRASVHLALPGLAAGGTDERAKAVAKRHGLSVRGIGGEHTPVGEGGVIDLSPSARLCVSEAEILVRLYRGIESLVSAERAA